MNAVPLFHEVVWKEWQILAVKDFYEVLQKWEIADFLEDLFLLFLMMYVYLCLCVVMCMCVQVPKKARRHWILLELELQAVVGHLMWMLGTELRCPEAWSPHRLFMVLFC